MKGRVFFAVRELNQLVDDAACCSLFSLLLLFSLAGGGTEVMSILAKRSTLDCCRVALYFDYSIIVVLPVDRD